MTPVRGDVWLFDLGMAEKVRPALVISVAFGDADRALVTIVPHTTSLRGSQFEIPVSVPFLKAGAFLVQGVSTYPRVSRAVRSSKPNDHDFATIARGVVEQAIGQKLDGSPLDDPNAGKNPAAVALGKLGGAKGGTARAAALSPRKRKEIARKAAKARWSR